MGQLSAIYWSGCGEDHLERFGFAQADYRISFEVNNNGKMETNTIQFGKPASPLPHPYASIIRDGRRLVFEFPVDLYSNLVAGYLGPKTPKPQNPKTPIQDHYILLIEINILKLKCFDSKVISL